MTDLMRETEIAPICHVCGSTEEHPPRTPSWYEVAAFDSCQWLAETQPVPAGNAGPMLRDEAPVPGNRYDILVWSPFRALRGEDCWVSFQPPLLRYNGSESPEESLTTAFVRCRPLAEFGRRSIKFSGRDQMRRCIRVEVQEVLSLQREIPSSSGLVGVPKDLFEGLSGIVRVDGFTAAWKNWVLLDWSMQGDVGASYLLEWDQGQYVLRMEDHWDFHTSYLYLGRRGLGTEASELLAHKWELDFPG